MHTIVTNIQSLDSEEFLNISPLDKYLCIQCQPNEPYVMSYGINCNIDDHTDKITLSTNMINIDSKKVLINQVDILQKIKCLEEENKKLKNQLEKHITTTNTTIPRNIRCSRRNINYKE